MISLDTASKKLEIKLAGAVATTELPFVASYVDINQTTFAMSASSEADGATTGATAVVVVAAPGATTTRKLNYLSVVNVDTAAVTLTVQVNNAATLRIVLKVALAVGDQLSFTDAGGWTVFDASGNRKQIIGGVLPASSFPALSGDVTTTAGSLVTAIGANKVTVGMLAQAATMTVLGRSAAGTGDVSALTTLPTTVQDNITRLGTVVAGVWNAGAVTSSVNSPGATTGPAFLNTSLATSENGIRLLLQAQGENNTGDAWIRFISKDGGVSEKNWSLGIDTSDSQSFGLGVSQSPGASTVFRITTGGVLTLAALVSGNLTSASGVITSSSDERMKKIVPGRYPYGLAEIRSLVAAKRGLIRYHWNKKSGLPMKEQRAGMGAQTAHRFIPESAFKHPKTGQWGFDDRPWLGASLQAIVALDTRLRALEGKAA